MNDQRTLFTLPPASRKKRDEEVLPNPKGLQCITCGKQASMLLRKTKPYKALCEECAQRRRMPHCACCDEPFKWEELGWHGDKHYCLECLEKITELYRRDIERALSKKHQRSSQVLPEVP